VAIRRFNREDYFSVCGRCSLQEIFSGFCQNVNVAFSTIILGWKWCKYDLSDRKGGKQPYTFPFQGGQHGTSRHQNRLDHDCLLCITFWSPECYLNADHLNAGMYYTEEL